MPPRPLSRTVGHCPLSQQCPHSPPLSHFLGSLLSPHRPSQPLPNLLLLCPGPQGQYLLECPSRTRGDPRLLLQGKPETPSSQPDPPVAPLAWSPHSAQPASRGALPALPVCAYLSGGPALLWPILPEGTLPLQPRQTLPGGCPGYSGTVPGGETLTDQWGSGRGMGVIGEGAPGHLQSLPLFPPTRALEPHSWGVEGGMENCGGIAPCLSYELPSHCPWGCRTPTCKRPPDSRTLHWPLVAFQASHRG